MLMFTQQACATIVNYTCLVSPDSKRKIHLFADVHVDSPQSAEQVNDELISFLHQKHNAVFYVDGHEKNDYKIGPEHFHKAITYLASKNLLDIRDFRDRPYCPKNFELVYKLLTFHQADPDGTQQQIKLIQQISYSPLSKVEHILVKHGIHIKDDKRLKDDKRSMDQENLSVLSQFDDDMINDCLNASNDVIIFAGIAHIKNLENVLRSHRYSIILSLKDTNELIGAIFGNYPAIEVLCAQESVKAYHTGIFENMDAFNDYFTHIIDFSYSLKMRDFAIKPDLLSAAVVAAEELASVEIYKNQPLFDLDPVYYI